MKKELLISAKFDTSDMDRSIENMQRKLKDLYAPADNMRAQNQLAQRLGQTGVGGLSGVGQDQYARQMQSTRRDLDAYIKEQAQGQEKLTKIIAKREAMLDNEKKRQKEMLKGTQEELALKEKIARVQENNFRLNEMYQQRSAVLNQGLNARKSVSPSDIPSLLEAFKGGGFRYGMSQIPGAFSQNPAGMWGSVAGAPQEPL